MATTSADLISVLGVEGRYRALLGVQDNFGLQRQL